MYDGAKIIGSIPNEPNVRRESHIFIIMLDENMVHTLQVTIKSLIMN